MYHRFRLDTSSAMMAHPGSAHQQAASVSERGAAAVQWCTQTHSWHSPPCFLLSSTWYIRAYFHPLHATTLLLRLVPFTRTRKRVHYSLRLRGEGGFWQLHPSVPLLLACSWVVLEEYSAHKQHRHLGDKAGVKIVDGTIAGTICV